MYASRETLSGASSRCGSANVCFMHDRRMKCGQEPRRRTDEDGRREGEKGRWEDAKEQLKRRATRTRKWVEAISVGSGRQGDGGNASRTTLYMRVTELSLELANKDERAFPSSLRDADVLSRLSFDRIDVAIWRFPSFPAGGGDDEEKLDESSMPGPCALSIDFVTRKTTRPSPFALERESDLECIKDAALNGQNNNFTY